MNRRALLRVLVIAAIAGGVAVGDLLAQTPAAGTAGACGSDARRARSGQGRGALPPVQIGPRASAAGSRDSASDARGIDAGQRRRQEIHRQRQVVDASRC